MNEFTKALMNMVGLNVADTTKGTTFVT